MQFKCKIENRTSEEHDTMIGVVRVYLEREHEFMLLEQPQACVIVHIACGCFNDIL